ncbi:hypothetical protein G7Z17_g3033 [Cylindrodendrum hubeiense]|uniref:Uncharacterized protein n=1 Tax=Cylindrodendrum hubeiense TaxID=595255 RepID=A0A9P5HHQ9_9HYPO|nr:hypothetical protein G7Z17_g3033 [Cylindrodendrum hubeiense]
MTSTSHSTITTTAPYIYLSYNSFGTAEAYVYVPLATTTVTAAAGSQDPNESAAGTATNGFSSSESVPTTSTTGTPAATSTNATKSGHSGVSTGAIAGAAVGCAIAGLLFGFAAAFILLRRRWKKNDARPHNTTIIAPTHESKDYASIAASPSGTEIELDPFLLAATPDKEICTELQALSVLIHQHVEAHYDSRSIIANPSTLSQGLINLGFAPGSGLSVDDIAALCIQPESRQSALRQVISHIIFRSIDVNSRSSLSMLPAPLAAFLQSIPPAEQHRGNPQIVSLALSKWRSLSALLLHPDAVERSPLPVSGAAVAPQALALANALNTFLHYFVASDGASRDQADHLQAVIIECTKLGSAMEMGCTALRDELWSRL